MMPSARTSRAMRFAPLVLLALGGLGFLKWTHTHEGIISGDGKPASVRCYACHGPLSRRLPSRPVGRPVASPVAMALAPDGTRLYASCEGTDELVVLDPRARAVVARWPVGGAPHGVAVAPDDGALWVALRGENRVAVLDPGTGRETGSVGVGKAPRGLAFASGGATLVVANSGSDDVSLVDARSRAEITRLPAGREPYAVAADPEGPRVRILNRMAAVAAFPAVPSSEITTIDVRERRVVGRATATSAHLGEGIGTDADRLTFVSLVRVRNLVPITQVSQGWVMTSILGVVGPGDDDVLQLPLDEVNAYFADPSALTLDPERGRIYVAAGGADCVTVVDARRVRDLAREEGEGSGAGRWADHLGISSEYVVSRVPVGPNPRALLLEPGGDRLFVAERLGASIAVVDTETLEVDFRFELSAEEPDGIRRGEILFHRADVTFQGQFSCRSCHPDGHVDGLAYDFAIDGMGRNILDNRSLLGLAGTAPFKWNGKNRDLFEQCGPRFARVLTRSDPFAPEDLECLVSYILSLPPVDGTGAATPAVARGRELFHRTSTNDGSVIPEDQRCDACHQPPLYTSRLRRAIGPRLPTDTVDEFDVPHLLGIAASAPYLHDGRALTLEEIWTVHSPDDTHGVVNDLTKEQLNDMVEFLKSL